MHFGDKDELLVSTVPSPMYVRLQRQVTFRTRQHRLYHTFAPVPADSEGVTDQEVRVETRPA
jgi:hypothetical protein